jgi:hypothetical protein
MNEGWADALLTQESFGTTRPAPSTIKFVGLVLACSADPNDDVTLTTPEIAARASLSRTVTIRSLTVLAETGWVGKRHQPRSKNPSYYLRRP